MDITPEATVSDPVDAKLRSLREEYSSLMAEVQELEKVYYLIKLEITSLNCEKDFYLTSLDEIDLLILKRQEGAIAKSEMTKKRQHLISSDVNSKKSALVVKTEEKTRIEPEKHTSDNSKSNDNPKSDTVPPKATIKTEHEPQQPSMYEETIPYQQPYPYANPRYPPVSTSSMPNPALPYSYVPQVPQVPQVSPVDMTGMPSTYPPQHSAQYMPMLSNYRGDPSMNHYQTLSPTLPSPTPYPMLTPQSPYYYMNSPSTTSNKIGEHTTNVQDAYMAIPLPRTTPPPPSTYVASQIPPNQS